MSGDADEPVGLVLSPVTVPADHVIPGSYRVPASCGHLCWIAPSGVALLVEHPDLETRCLDCLDPAEVTRVARLRPDQIAELRAFGGGS